MKEAAKALLKSDDSGRDWKIQALQRKVELLEKMITARRFASNDVVQMYSICQDLLSQRNVEETVRVGDIYGCMVESYYANGDVLRASEVLLEMEKALPTGTLSYCTLSLWNFYSFIICSSH